MNTIRYGTRRCLFFSSFVAALLRLLEFAILWLGIATVAAAEDRYWIGGNADWTNSDTNWSDSPAPPQVPSEEPNASDVANFNTSHSVDLTNAAESIAGLRMSNGIRLDTNDNFLSVNGPIQLSGTSTDLVIGGSNSIVTALHAVTINSGADLTVAGGAMGVYGQSGVGLLDVNSGAELSGNGEILLADNVAGSELFELDGTLTAHSTASFDLQSVAAATMTITVSDPDAVIDLDGNSGNSTINVSRNDTLAINGGVLDNAYSGTINLSAGATFHRNEAWSFDGTLNANTSGNAAATISGGTFMQFGGSINVDAGESLRFASEFHANFDSTIANNGLIIFDNAARITYPSVQFQTGSQGSIEVNNGEVQISTTVWDWDGDGGLDNRITINDLGILTVYEQADEPWVGAMYINGGELLVVPGDLEWEQSGGLINIGGTTASGISAAGGFNKIGGAFNVEPAASVYINCWSVWSGGALNVDGALALSTVTWSGGIAVSGNGLIRTSSSSVVTASTTINIHTFDWDDSLDQNTVHTINNGAVFTLNITDFDADDDDMDDRIILAGTGAQLNVSGPAEWTMNNKLIVDPGVGAFIGGTSRMVLAGVLDVNGDAGVTAPITFAAGSTTNVSADRILWVSSGNTRYAGGSITGPGTYIPGTSNTVQSSSTISAAKFGFDYGSWTISPGATLTVFVDDYDVVDGTFDNTISVESGVANIITGDAEFVLNVGRLRLLNTSGAEAVWTGEPLAIGDDAGTAREADLRVGGSGISRINVPVTFYSDADLFIEAGSTLVLNGDVFFHSVNGANEAFLAGQGRLVTNSNVRFTEATTFNMSAGTVDFDGEDGDSTRNRFDIDAPLVINAAVFEDFGAFKDPLSDFLDIDHKLADGSLTINLTDPNAEWTLDTFGALNLVNDDTIAVLLAGSDVNIYGGVGVSGQVQTDARIDLFAPGSIHLGESGERFQLNGGNNTDRPNTIVGGSIGGPGVLATSDGHALQGYGQITAEIDFDGASNVLAQGGTLYLVGPILDVGTLGTADSSAILDVINPWNTNATDLVQLNGGELRGGVVGGGTVTNDGAAGINGHGLISARVINNTRIDAEGGTLLVETANNDNDWDGDSGTGSLNAVSGDLEIRDDAAFQFTGAVSAAAGREIFASDFELEFEPGSTLSLADGARYRSTNGTDIGGAVTVTGGTASLQVDGTTVFETDSETMLSGHLRLENAVTEVQAGAMFAGGGMLINAQERILRLLDGANVGVLIENQGTLELGASPGQVQGLDFQQDPSGTLEIELAGIGLDEFDRLALTGQAQLAGALNVSLLDGFTPALGNEFRFLSAAGGIAGTFESTSLPDLAGGLSWSISYNPTNVQLSVIRGLAGDYNSDGTVDASDYVVWRKNDGTQAGYETWRANFGATAGGAAAVDASGATRSAVPEPGTLMLAYAGLAIWTCLRFRSLAR
jgi:hypothetical protein